MRTRARETLQDTNRLRLNIRIARCNRLTLAEKDRLRCSTAVSSQDTVNVSPHASTPAFCISGTRVLLCIKASFPISAYADFGLLHPLRSKEVAHLHSERSLEVQQLRIVLWKLE